MNLKVGELEEVLAKRQEGSVNVKLGDLSVAEDATVLYYPSDLTSGSQALTLDDTANHALAKYLKVPVAYYDKLTPDFRTEVLKYEFERNKDAATTLETLNGDLVAVHSTNSVMLPLGKVSKVIEKVFSPEDTVRRMITTEARFHVDVTSAKHVLAFPNEHGLGMIEGKAVGDVTEAGVRFLAYPFRAIQPSCSVYAERLICMNGQTVDEQFSKISLKGRTVDEVIIEMEEAANLVLGSLDGYLEKLGQTRMLYPPGSPQAFAAQLAREANVSRKVLDSVLDIINQLPEPVSVWDVNQAFTSVANQATSYALMSKLQNLGGDLAFSAEKMIERCTTCERRL